MTIQPRRHLWTCPGTCPSPAPGAGKRPLPLPLLNNSKLPYCHSLTLRPKRFCPDWAFQQPPFPSDHLCALLLRRLRLPFALSARSCRCRRPLDPLGDHRAACARALGPRVAQLGYLAVHGLRQPAHVVQVPLGLVLCGVGDAHSSERQLVFAGRRGPV